MSWYYPNNGISKSMFKHVAEENIVIEINDVTHIATRDSVLATKWKHVFGSK